MARLAADNFGLLFALLGSVLLHLAVLLGMPMMHPTRADAPHLIEVRLVPAAPLVSSAKIVVPSAPSLLVPEQAEPALAISPPPIIPVAIEKAEASAPASTPAVELSVVAEQSGIASAVVSSPGLTYYPIEQVDKPPRLLGEIQQVYPMRAHNEGVEGFVTLSLLINEHGEVDEIRVVESSPRGFFEESAIAMLRGKRFTPAIKQGRVVKSAWLKTVRFKLVD